MDIENLNKKIRMLKSELIDNLDSDLRPIDLNKDAQIEKELSLLYKERVKLQSNKIDTLSNMYLKLYA